MNQVAIIGAGPAGIAAALQLKKYNIDFYIFEKKRIGGLLWEANHITNYPGYPKGISGPNICNIYSKQLKNLNIEVIFDDIICIKFSKIFTLESYFHKYDAKYLIYAAGTIHKKLEDILINNSKLLQYDSDSAIQLNGAKIIIIGAGDAAFDYAMKLSRENIVTILNRSDHPKANPELLEQVKINRKIELYNKVKINAISQEKARIFVNFSADGKYYNMECQSILVAIGRHPNLNLVENLPKECYDKIFFAGDVQNGIYRQSTIAISDGIKAAMMIFEREKS